VPASGFDLDTTRIPHFHLLQLGLCMSFERLHVVAKGFEWLRRAKSSAPLTHRSMLRMDMPSWTCPDKLEGAHCGLWLRICVLGYPHLGQILEDWGLALNERLIYCQGHTPM
jgi:hypothetical protein